MNNEISNAFQAMSNTVAHDIIFSVFINQLDDILDGKENSTITHADDFQKTKFQSILTKVNNLLAISTRVAAYHKMLQDARQYWQKMSEEANNSEDKNNTEKMTEIANSLQAYEIMLSQFEEIMQFNQEEPEQPTEVSEQ